MTVDSVALYWLKKKLGSVFWVQDGLWKIFYAEHQNVVDDFLSGRYVDKVSGNAMMGFYMFKKKQPYLPLINLSSQSQVDYYRVEIYSNFTELSEEDREQGVLFLFRMNDQEGTKMFFETDNMVESADITLADLSAYGLQYYQILISDITLETMHTLFNLIFEPLISYQEHVSESTEPNLSKQSYSSDLNTDYDFMKKDVLMTHFLRFEQAINSTSQKLSGGISFEVPVVLLEALKSDKEMTEPSLLGLLLSTCNGWLSQLQDTLNWLEDGYQESSTPMKELSYWRDRYTTLDMISKQLHTPPIASLIHIQNSKTGLMEPSSTRLESLLTEAKENNRFLSTCERHFKNIEMGSNYQIVIESIVPLMKSLRLIWMISKHYNEDEKMMSLMEKVAKVLIERVRRVNSLQTIFRNSPQKVQIRMDNASILLTLWKQAYLETRHFIETSGRGTRWEFDRKRLFLMTDYMASVCQSIGNSVQVIDEFNHLYELNIFTVTMKQPRVVEMKQNMQNLILSFQNVKFDPYDPSNERLWLLKMEAFQKELSDIEVMSQLYMQDAFRNLRSPIMGIQLLKSLNSVLERSSLTQTLNEKLKDIHASFLNQVERTRQDFIDNSSNPPLFKSQPAVSGAIHWQKFMFSRLKNILITLLAETDFMSVEYVEKLKESYLSLCRIMREFSQYKYQYWVDRSSSEVEQLLKAPIFNLPNQQAEPAPKGNRAMQDSSFIGSYLFNSKFSSPNSFKSNGHSSKTKQEGASLPSDSSIKGNNTKYFDKSQSNSRKSDKLSFNNSNIRNKNTAFSYTNLGIDQIRQNTNNSNPKSVTNALSVYRTVSSPRSRDLKSYTIKNSMAIKHRATGAKFHSHIAKGDPSLSQRKTSAALKSGAVPMVMVMNESLKENTHTPEVDIIKENLLEINFDPYLFEIILEAKHLEAIGYFIPEAVKNAVLLEQNYHDKILLLNSFIVQYNNEIEKLTKVDFMVLEEHIKNLFRVVCSGTKRINWRTACIPEFIESCKSTLEEFLSIVYQYKKDISRIETRIENVEKAVFFSDKSIFNVGLVLDCKEYFESLKVDREQVIEKLATDFEDITSIIQHIGFVIWKSNSWKCNKMKPFYSYYENRIYQALTNMVTSNLKIFIYLLTNSKTLFQIYGVLYHPYLNLNPSQVNVLKYITQCALECVYTTKHFPRWLEGSAVPVAANKADEELYAFTFLNDIALNPEIILLVKKIQLIAEGILNKANEELVPWGKFEVVWQSDKELMVQEWIERNNPKATDYDDALFSLKAQLFEIQRKKNIVEIDSIKLNLAPLVSAVTQHYMHLFDIYIHELHLVARHALVTFKNDCEKKLEDMSFKPVSIDHLKNVLQLLNEISNSEVERFLNVREFKEKYDVLEIYEVSLSDEEKLLLNTIDMLDRFLTDKARTCSHKLTFVKKRFAEIASKEAFEFYRTLDEFVDKFNSVGPGMTDDLEAGLTSLREFLKEANKFEEKRLDITNSQKLFDLSLVSSGNFTALLKQLADIEVVYNIFKSYRKSKGEWEMTQWSELNVQVLKEGIGNFIANIRKLPSHIKNLKVYGILKDMLNLFVNNLPIIVELKNEALRERHWKTLIELTHINMDTSDLNNFSLKNIFAMNLESHYDVVTEIIINAIKEASIERSIKEVDYTWNTMRFILTKYSKSVIDKGHILGTVDEINALLDDHIMQLQGMSASRSIGPFMSAVQKLEKQLSVMSETIYLWVNAQQKWLYLDSIFILSDIKIQLPEEAKLFDKLDKIYTKIMKSTSNNPIVKVACLESKRFKAFEELIIGLDKCQKSLIEYLDSKRNIFPRFYFISDDELLSVIGSTDPYSIQEHIIKMFDNVASLKFHTQSSQLEIVGMKSAEGEELQFSTKTIADGKVEIWMNNVLLAMQSSNRIITKEAIFYYCFNGTSRISWMLKYQGMVALAGDQVWWTWEVEDVFMKTAKGNKQAMKKYYQKLVSQLDDLVLMVRKPLESNVRKKFNTILIIDVHARDIIESFVRDSVLSVNDFQWESQLRFYWSLHSDQLMTQQCSGWFAYGYEYMGLNGRLVITPLTDRIYLTITQALSLKLGGAPAGPAGTGKTETTKDLAKALGLLCVVTNCGEGMDYKAIGKIFAGLCQCGCWGCFDEFNRIEVSVLSVVSSQLQTIRNALLLNVSQFYFEGEVILLDNKIGIFITMNPGYAGRTELPESIKALFRPVVCIVPDSQMICEIMLFSEGFLMAKVLAKKMTVLYNLAMEQLSKQHHYDFQLRAIKAVLIMAGELKRSSDAEEDVTLMRSLRDMNLPKFVFEDIPLFIGLINDLFPGLNCPRVQYPEYNAAIEEALKENNNIILPHQIDKVVQLYETMLTRHTTMVVGPTCGGKSVVINTLASAQTKLGIPTKLHTLNPKERSVIELYGSLDPVSRDWTDGLLSNIFREINKPTDKVERKYIVFDGDVDALWVENMNSVMDDNRLLTLANGERIRLQKHCSMLFEVSDLQYAQPSTVSRCGMVYVDPKNLKYEPYWERWLIERFNSKQKEAEIENFKSLYAKYIPDCINLIFEGKCGKEKKDPLKSIIPLSSLNLIKQLTFLLDALIDQDDLDIDVVECLFIEAIYWSLGMGLLEDDRIIFDAFVKNISGMMLSARDEVKANNLPGKDSSVYDFIFDIESKMWHSWSKKVPEYIHDYNLKFNEILVPTQTTVSIKWAVNLFVSREIPVLLSGESGTSKTVTVNNFLKGLNQDLYQVLCINFSSRTTSFDCQRNLENSTEKRTRDIYGPPVGKRLVVFVDDLNMPQVDLYGTQQPIAMLKQLIGYSGVYDRGSLLNWKYLKDLDWVASMGNPGGGRNNVDPRFISLFSFIYVVFPSEESIFHIYNNILESHTASFSHEIKSVLTTITTMSMTLFKDIIKDLPPTPSKFHYIFSLRDLSRLYCGLCLTNPNIFTNEFEFMRVWRHECLRVFTDKLNTQQDLDIVSDKIKSLIATNAPDTLSFAMQDPIIYGDFKTFINENPTNLYEDLENYENLKIIFKEILEEYERLNEKCTLVLFENALSHLCRIYRIIRLPQGHCLLTGQENVGKTSMTKIATFIAGYEYFTIELSRGYNENNFRDDLKLLYDKVCSKNQQVTFLFKDKYIVEENFLELINNMLTLGVVPALYSEEEKEQILSALKKEYSQEGVTKEMLWQHFAKKAINNLHIVVNMNASNPSLASRCRNFPGLVNNTHINWVFAWPKQALHAVASSIISEDNELLTSELHHSVVEHCVFVHININEVSIDYYEKLRRKNFVSPTNYLDFLNSFLRLISEQNVFILNQCDRLSEGMKKLIESAEQIDSLNEKLTIQKAAVLDKTQACSELLDGISSATTEAEAKQGLALMKSSQIEIQKIDITREKNEATYALSKAMPVLEAARHTLDLIDKNDVTEIRSFTKPPLPVQTIVECIVVLKGIKDVSWKSAKALMADTNFLKSLKEMDADNIPMKNINIVKYYLKQMNITSEEMKEKSKAGAGLMKFVQAVVGYCEVYKDVKPKKEKVEKLEKEYNMTMHEFSKMNSQLIGIQLTLDTLQVKYEKAILEKKTLEDETNLMQRRLYAADRLITGLGSERVRWQKDLEVLADQKKYIIGDSLLCAGFLAYSSPFTWQYRKKLIYEIWKNNVLSLGIMLRPEFSITTVLTNDVEISRWTSEGLPPDELSIQNAILATKANRFPLCIDPQQQATNWIKQKEKNIKSSTFNAPDYMKNLQLAVKYGTSFLFQEVDDYLDPLLDNILAKNYDKKNGTIMMGDKRIDYDTNFKLYLTTKLPNPNYTADFFGLAIVINFMVTMIGLEEQLLGVIVKIEKNELEERREQLIFETSKNKTLLKELEDSLLKELAQSTGNMLDNAYLLNTLESTKLKSSEVAEKLRLASLTTEEIDKNRDIYRPIAKLGALLFFVLADLSTINEMYQYSLSGYIKVFELSLRKSYPDIRITNRLKNISTSLLSSLYIYGCTGIFERHKLLFSMQMTIKLQLDKNLITEEELTFLTKGKVSLEKSDKPPPFEWLSSDSWENLIALRDVLPNNCGSLIDDIEENESVWKEWYEKDNPESNSYPMSYNLSLNDFQKLLLLRCFRLDRIFIGITSFIKRSMGVEFISPPIISLSNIYDQSSPTTPIIFILSAGSDPTSDLLKFAEFMDFKSTNVKILSLGQGQEKSALNLLSMAMIHGQWLILQNCHLLLKFMKEFEKEFEGYSKPHPHFRLWLTTEPVYSFPISILQRSFKVVTEPPIGLKNNLQSIYLKLVPPVLEKESSHHYYPVLVYVLSFFHAVVQERRKYGKIGWNIAYDFSDSDLTVCINIMQVSLQKILNLDEAVPWMSLKYLIGQVMYGGRVIDDFDRRTIATYMDEYMGDFLLDSFQNFHFFENQNCSFLLPKASVKEEFYEYIEKLPSVTPPMVLGLNGNAEIRYFLNAGQSVLEYMKRLQPRSKSEEASGSKEEVVDKTAKDILSKMQKEFLIDKIREDHSTSITPSIVVLLQELERFNLLTKKIVASLIMLRRGLAGEVGMDNDLEEISNSLYLGILPKSWMKLTPATKKSLGSWITFYLDRHKQYTEWAFVMEPEVMWMPGLHIPGSYITALIQMTCRKNGWPLEKSTLFTKVTVESESNDALERIRQGKAVSGLYLEGAGWDVKNCCLERQKPKKLWTSMPCIKLVPMLRSKLRLANTLRTPVYVTSDRRNAMGVGLVFEADLPTVHHLSHWILQGVCLVLNPE